MRLPNLQPLVSALQKHGVSATSFVLRRLLTKGSDATALAQEIRSETPDKVVDAAPLADRQPTRISLPLDLDAPAHVPCKIYYPNRKTLSAEQRRYYLYWREQFRRGNILVADATYRYLYAYELVGESKNVTELDDAWSALCLSYLDDKRFASYVASWIVDLRFLENRFVVDEVLALHVDPAVRVDVTLLAKQTPEWADVVGAVMRQATDVIRVAEFLADGYGDITAVTALAAHIEPISVHDTLLQGLLTRSGIGRLVKLRDERPSFVVNDGFRKPIGSLVARACSEMGIDFTEAHGNHYVVSGHSEARDAIVRDTLPIRPFPAANSFEGLQATLRHGLDDDARMLLAVVLAASERFPYVDGRVDAAKTLREPFEAFSLACGSKATLGTFRRAFFELGRGERAVWIIEPPVREAIDIKMNQVVARFTKGLQRELYGTNARRSIIDAIAEGLSTRTGRPKSVLIDALSTNCAATSSLLPIVNEKVGA